MRLMKQHTTLELERVEKEGFNNPREKFVLSQASADHYKCVMYDEDGNGVIKGNYRAYPVIKLSHFFNTVHASGVVYQVVEVGINSLKPQMLNAFSPPQRGRIGMTPGNLRNWKPCKNMCSNHSECVCHVPNREGHIFLVLDGHLGQRL